MPVPFIKMHGLGNDFVILDARVSGFMPTAQQIVRIADRHRGVGFDQLVVLEKPRTPATDLFMHIFNCDGSRAGACGNVTRCVARLEHATSDKKKIFIETDAGVLQADVAKNSITIDMGEARTEWKDIPLVRQMDTLAIDTGKAGLPLAVGVNVGNPHAVFFVDRVEVVDVPVMGPQIETHPLFPEKTNVSFAEVIDRNTIRLRVWERGVGITQACGSAACATLVAAVRRDLSEHKAKIILDGGELQIEWLENGHVLMTGGTSYSFKGELSDELLGTS